MPISKWGLPPPPYNGSPRFGSHHLKEKKLLGQPVRAIHPCETFLPFHKGRKLSLSINWNKLLKIGDLPVHSRYGRILFEFVLLSQCSTYMHRPSCVGFAWSTGIPQGARVKSMASRGGALSFVCFCNSLWQPPLPLGAILRGETNVAASPPHCIQPLECNWERGAAYMTSCKVIQI